MTSTIPLGDPGADPPRPGATGILRAIDMVWEAAGALAMVTATLLVFANAVARYLLAKSIPWADEVVIGLIPWIAMIGLYISIRRGSVIRIEYFFLRLPARFRPTLVVATALLSAGAFVHLALYSLQYLSFFGRDLTPYLGIMRGWFAASLLVGAASVAALFLAQAAAPLVARRSAR
jgi:TRAP-type C4-dicarboxylate transport system permease small subunit